MNDKESLSELRAEATVLRQLYYDEILNIRKFLTLSLATLEQREIALARVEEKLSDPLRLREP